MKTKLFFHSTQEAYTIIYSIKSAAKTPDGRIFKYR